MRDIGCMMRCNSHITIIPNTLTHEQCKYMTRRNILAQGISSRYIGALGAPNYFGNGCAAECIANTPTE